MDVWAVKYFGQASFICVSCDGASLATAFANRLQLSKCLLTYVDDASMPKWGQLGCNGFIVIGADGKVVNPKTSAFLEVNELAFSHVENILDSLLAGGAPPALAPGQHVELHGLSKAELNGTRGFIVAAPNETGRYAVETYFGKTLAVRPENLRVFEDDGEEGEDGEDFDRTTGGCAQPAGEPKKQKKQCATAGGGGCSTGGGGGCGECEPEMPERMKRALAKKAAEAEEAALTAVAPLAEIHSVHVTDLDAEHDKCAAALAELVKKPTRLAIIKVLNAYTAHFKHEEQMLDQHLYAAAAAGEGGGGFSKEASMRRSHYADHAKMIDELRTQAAALDSTGGNAPAAFVDSVLRAFENHANVYDAAYAEPLAAQLGVAAH